MVMPEMGLELEPISPVSREETVTKRKPQRIIITAPMRFMCRLGANRMATMSAAMPTKTNFIERSRSVRGTVSQPAPDTMPDERQRAHQADDAARRDRARADVEHVGAANLVWAHLFDQHA